MLDHYGCYEGRITLTLLRWLTLPRDIRIPLPSPSAFRARDCLTKHSPGPILSYRHDIRATKCGLRCLPSHHRHTHEEDVEQHHVRQGATSGNGVSSAFLYA